MRLTKCDTLELVEFQENSIPGYAILSHRWQNDELSCQELATYNELNKRESSGSCHELRRIERKDGFQKIRSFCEIVTRTAEYGEEYAWADTCCIDKTSSAELSEAINSMYRWYADAKKCLVYLFDVQSPISPGPPTHEIKGINREYPGFTKSQWFKRGWTLQELIAPGCLMFYTLSWDLIGSKEDLVRPLASITGIDASVLSRQSDPRSMSIAARMSWASARTTTRTEDLAYCLLGLFGVNMPMLYGEGTNAFTRLQEEILKYSNDQSIFVWDMTAEFQSMLAPSPRAFALCAGIKNIPTMTAEGDHAAYSLTNNGLRIALPLLPWGIETCVAVLNCLDTRTKDSFSSQLECIWLRRVSSTRQFVRMSYKGQSRTRWKEPLSYSNLATTSPFYILHRFAAQAIPRLRRNGLKVRPLKGSDTGYRLKSVEPSERWDSEAGYLVMPTTNFGMICTLFFTDGNSSKHDFGVALGFDDTSRYAIALRKTGGRNKPSDWNATYARLPVQAKMGLNGRYLITVCIVEAPFADEFRNPVVFIAIEDANSHLKGPHLGYRRGAGGI